MQRRPGPGDARRAVGRHDQQPRTLGVQSCEFVDHPDVAVPIALQRPQRQLAVGERTSVPDRITDQQQAVPSRARQPEAQMPLRVSGQRNHRGGAVTEQVVAVAQPPTQARRTDRHGRQVDGPALQLIGQQLRHDAVCGVRPRRARPPVRHTLPDDDARLRKVQKAGHMVTVQVRQHDQPDVLGVDSEPCQLRHSGVGRPTGDGQQRSVQPVGPARGRRLESRSVAGVEQGNAAVRMLHDGDQRRKLDGPPTATPTDEAFERDAVTRHQQLDHRNPPVTARPMKNPRVNT